jgi:hypothetical protein
VAASALAACGSVSHTMADDAAVDTGSVDAGPIDRTLSQTNSESVTSGVGCRGTAPSDFIKENNFYRAFTLADFGVTGAFQVTKVKFGVYSATSGGVPVMTQPAEISIYAYSGPVGTSTVDLSKLTKQGGAMIQIPDTATPTTIEIPIDATLPQGTAGLVLQFHVADGSAAMHRLLFGGNQQGERTPAFQYAPLCGQTAPVTLPAAGLGIHALVLQVTGKG